MVKVKKLGNSSFPITHIALSKRLSLTLAPQSVSFLIVGQRMFDIPPVRRRFRRFLGDVRSWFPQAYAIGLRCCDHGGKVMRETYDICWGPWDWKRFDARWDGAGDGPCVFERISFWEFFKRRNRRSYD